MKERITVTLSAYNHEKFVGQALDRLAEQTIKDFKIIACDDGSTDQTFRILKEYESGKLAGKLKVLTHSGHMNRGIHHSINLLLNDVDTEFFFGQASDDFLEPEALEYMLGLLESNPQADFLYGQVKMVNDQGADLYRYDGTEEIGSGLPAAERLLFSNPIRAPSMFFRQSCKEYLLAVPPHLVFGDWYHNLLLFLEKKPHYYLRPVVNYRLHSDNVSLGRSETKYFEHANDVAAALFKAPAIQSQPTLKGGLLAILQSKDDNKKEKSADREIMAACLAQIPEGEKRLQILRRCWDTLRERSPHGTASLMAILPLRETAILLLKNDPLSVFHGLLQDPESRSFVSKKRVLIQLAACFSIWVKNKLRGILRILTVYFK